MKIAAVICEYNPFHNGHKYQLELARKLLGCDAIIGIMSGNYVQRGDVAVFPKQTRAKIALENGADLILELPAILTLQSAEKYALNAIETLNSLGCADYLFFGAECPDTELLISIASVLAEEDSDFKLTLRRGLDSGVSFAAARAAAVKEILGDASAEILSRPNNILAVEYCKALIKTNSTIKPYAIARKGTGHDTAGIFKGFASASEIRRRIQNCENIDGLVPETSSRFYADIKPVFLCNFDKAITASLSMASPGMLAQIPDVSEGLEYAIIRAAYEESTVNGIISSVKSKRYAFSRLRRIILNYYLKITKADAEIKPQYIKILDFNEIGQSVLNYAKSTAVLPLAKNGKQIKNNPKALTLWQRELMLDRVYEIFK